jgi:hypothetical protein
VIVVKTLLDGSGRIELPEFVQMKLGVKPGDELALDEENGRWFIQLANSCNDSREPPRPADAGDVTPCLEPPRNVLPPADTDADDLHWEELDYEPVPLKHTASVPIHVEQRGRLKPMLHHLDEE